MNRIVGMVLLGLLAAVPTGVLTASPAVAEGTGCCQVSIDDLPAQFPAGGAGSRFTVRVVNQSLENIRYLRVSFLFQAQGLVGDLVDLRRQRVSGEPRDIGTFTQRGVHSGAVTATEQIDLGVLALPPGSATTITYQLSFSKKMPSTPLSLSIQVQPRRDATKASSAGPYQSSIVAAGQSIQTEPTPAVSDSPESTDEPAPVNQSPLAGAGSSRSEGGSLAWLVYTLGALLLLGGAAMIAMLVWRRGPRDEADADEPRRPAGTTYPPTPARAGGYEASGWPNGSGGHGGPSPYTAPTAQYPIPQDPYTDPDPTWRVPPAGR